jgi:hypothetical protein
VVVVVVALLRLTLPCLVLAVHPYLVVVVVVLVVDMPLLVLLLPIHLLVVPQGA